MGDLIPFRKRTARKWTRPEDYDPRRPIKVPRRRRWLLGGWTPWIVLVLLLAVWQFGFVEHRPPQRPEAAPATRP